MSDLLAARSQMGMSLGFHIIFAVIGIGMPALMVGAEWRWQRTGETVYLALAERWAKGTAILFAVGAVSGTVLSFELGLLWPTFMREAGAVVGFPFSLEGFAFFAEAIFLGVYLYGWRRVSRRMHLIAGMLVAAAGAASALFVVTVNAWMNTPIGAQFQDGRLVTVHPLEAMRTPAALPEVLHMLLAAYAATGFVVAGIHAFLLLRMPTSRFHRAALSIALLVGGPAAVLQPLSGDISARYVARWQPPKLAAMEAEFKTEHGAPLRLGGLPNTEAQTTRYALEIPDGLSLLAFHDPHALVRGLDAFPRDLWPPVALVHAAFDLMVVIGSYLAVVALWTLVVMARGSILAEHRRHLWVLVVAGPLGFLAIEAGWIVTEVGRQPWTIYGQLRTADAVTPAPGLVLPFVVCTVLYCMLGAIVLWLLAHQVVGTSEDVDPPIATARPSGALRPAPHDTPRDQ